MSHSVAPLSPSTASRARWWAWRPQLSNEMLALAASAFFALACNGMFWRSAMSGHGGDVKLALSLFLLLLAVHGLLLGLLLWRGIAKPVLTVLLITTAFAAHYMNSYSVYLDADMLRNVLATDHKESRELMTPALIAPLLFYAVLPILVLWRVRLIRRSPLKALAIRIGFLVGMLALGGVAAMLSFQDLSAMMRNHREIRYLATPINYLVALRQNFKSDSPTRKAPKLPLEHDAKATAR
ncbi:MAG: DUF1705 domain-containing protein, partial [Xanthomonas sp.]